MWLIFDIKVAWRVKKKDEEEFKEGKDDSENKEKSTEGSKLEKY